MRYSTNEKIRKGIVRDAGPAAPNWRRRKEGIAHSRKKNTKEAT